MSKGALLTLHGQGDTKIGYSKGLREELEERLDDKFHDLSFREIFYQGILQSNQREYWDDVKDMVNWDGLRQFVLFGFGDPATLEATAEIERGCYAQVQVEVARNLLQARADLGGNDGPLVIVAQSLGGQVISNYLWDGQKKAAGGIVSTGIWANIDLYASDIKPGGLTAAEMAYLMQPRIVCLVTTGCNIPIFVSGVAEREPIAKPSPEFEWHNYYDKEDVLGWPLQPLSPKYRALVSDHVINAAKGLFSALFKSWNPLSHGAYWGDDDVLDPLEATLRRFL